ncbi:MAG: CoA transferase, partial [Proteobacteria bacterium]|nr:CoA transferase [Pseudomonadota bacterium]
EARLNAAASHKTIREWCDILDKAGVPAGPLNDMTAALAHPQLEARKVIQTVKHPVAGDYRCVASAVRLSDSPREAYEPSPVLGADTARYIAEILKCPLEEAEQIVRDHKYE